MSLVVPYEPQEEDYNNADQVLIVPQKQKIVTDKIGLIDADFLKYFVIHAIKKDIDKKVAHLKDPAVKYTRKYLADITEIFDCPGFIFCFSGPSEMTFRKAVGFQKLYKGTRSYEPKYPNEGADKKTVIEYIRERYPTLLYRDLEADDLLGMLQDDQTFIYSYDKDLKQIPGTHFDIKHKHFFDVSKGESLMFIMRQMITGDSVDNIPGLVNNGDVKADELLTGVTPKEAVNKVFRAYITTHGYIDGIDAFVESWNLLKMRNKRGDYFRQSYQGAFDVLEAVKLTIKNNENE